ncbi:MAG TPA: MFS transporter [Streptosporangiaceae bacterium]|nr:MFS transporter [Streptosporangiaceae bacterium]
MTVAEVRGSEGTRRWWALGGLSLALLAVGLDGTVLSVALPTLAGTLHASATDLQWFVSAYTLALAAALLPGGLLGDRFGRKKVMTIALTLFGLGSVACAYSPNPGVFIAARVLLGLSAGAMVPLVLSGVAVMFSDEERPRAVAVWAAANFLALPIGPILGGWLLSSYWWGWVFLMNLPVVVVGLIAVGVLVPESRAPQRPGLDPLGIVASVGGLTVLVYGFVAAGQYGWTSVTAVAAMAAGVLVLVGFTLWELRLGHRPGGQPLVDMRLFRSARFTSGTALQALGVFGLFGLLFGAPQFFQAILGVDAMGSGVRLLPLIGALAAGAVLSDRVAQRLTAKVTAALGFGLLATGMALGATMTVSSDDVFIACWTALTGLGFGLALATAASAALVDLPKANAGIGSAVMQAVQKAFAPLSAAVLGSVLNAGYHSGLDLAGLPAAAASAVRGSVFAGLAVAHNISSPQLLDSVRTSFVHGIDTMLWVGTGIALAGVVLAVVFLPWHATAAGETDNSKRRGREAGREVQPAAVTGDNQ